MRLMSKETYKIEIDDCGDRRHKCDLATKETNLNIGS